jgi:hypothetical protein
MKNLVFLLAVLGLLMLTCSKKNITNNYYYGPEEEGASIVGVVYPPESGATVTAYMGIPVASTQIDAVGYFKFSNLPVGSYSLVVQAEGYYEETRKASVKEEITVVLDTIRLAPIGELILAAWPEDGARDVRVNESIRIQFRSIMNESSFVSAFHIEPKVEGVFSWSSKDPTYVTFDPTSGLAANTNYRVSVDTTAADTSGTRLLQSYEFAFTTERIRIEYTSPSSNQTGIPSYIVITIGFNANMDAASVASAFSLVDSDMGVLSGQLAWPNQQVMQFRPSSALAANETYTVTIDTTAKDIHGARLSPAYRFSFYTEAFRIDHTSPRDNDTLVSPLTGVQIAFNTDMDVESVDSAFCLVDSKLNEVAGDFAWSTPASLQFLPSSPLLVSETYTVRLDTTASTVNGTKLPEPYQFRFATARLTVVSHPGDNASGVHPTTNMSIAFNTYMNVESVNSAFSMVDSQQKAVTGEISWHGQNQMDFAPHSALALNEKYSVKVDSTASDIHGAKLAEPYQASFTTEPLTVRSSPGNGETWVSPLTEIQLSFNADMIMQSTNSAFRMVDSEGNQVTGNLVWSSQSQLEFDPHVALAAEKKYTALLDTSARSVQGDRLSERYQFSFTTQPIMIVDTSPRDGETWVPLILQILVAFNTDMDMESVMSAFEMVDSQQKAVDGDFIMYQGTWIAFHPNSALTPGETYTVSIGGSAADLHGMPLGTSYSFWFKTRQE